MYLRVITCPDCIKKASDFLVSITQDLKACSFFNLKKPEIPTYILARDTKATILKKWRQEIPDKKPSIWQKQHKIDAFGIEVGHKIQNKFIFLCYHHLTIKNMTHRREPKIFYCQAPEQIILCGPGANKHIDEDKKQIEVEKKDHKQNLETLKRKEAIEKSLKYYGLFTIDEPKEFYSTPETKKEEIYLALTLEQAEKITKLLKEKSC
jgi:hypothetical protein